MTRAKLLCPKTKNKNSCFQKKKKQLIPNHRARVLKIQQLEFDLQRSDFVLDQKKGYLGTNRIWQIGERWTLVWGQQQPEQRCNSTWSNLKFDGQQRHAHFQRLKALQGHARVSFKLVLYFSSILYFIWGASPSTGGLRAVLQYIVCVATYDGCYCSYCGCYTTWSKKVAAQIQWIC